MNMKVSYHKRFDPSEGTVYNQAVSMKKSEMLHLKLAIEAERAMGYPKAKQYESTANHAPIFLKPLRAVNGVVYLTHTQTRFMKLYLLEETRARMKDRNTCIIIKKQ